MVKTTPYMNEDREEGFSLVELLVVIVIIGILSAIAIGVFLNQRKKANDASVESDIRHVATTIETMLVDSPNAVSIEVMPSEDTAEILVKETEGSTPLTETISLSSGVRIETVGENDSNWYAIRGYHINGDKYTDNTPEGGLTYDSASGGFVPQMEG